MINPGEFRDRVFFNVVEEAQQSDYGDFAQSSSTTTERLVKVKFLQGSEDVSSGVLSLIKQIEITMRRNSLPNPERVDTITYDSETYYIKSVEFKGQGNQQLIILKAHTPSD